MILASVLLFSGCAQEEYATSFDNIKLDKTFLVLPVDGGTVELKINATESWAFDTTYTKDVWPNVIARNNDKSVKSCEPSWLSVDKFAGDAGETVVTFSAEAVPGGRELELCIKAGANSQFVKVRQGSLEAVSATCKDVIDGPDGKTFRVKGVVTSIENTVYGNWWLDDGTGSVLIYGTLDKDGKTKNFESLGIEVGDVVEVEGPKLTYGVKVELVDVTVLSIEKALLKIVTPDATVEAAGAELPIKIAYKGQGVFPSISEDAQDWLSIVSTETKFGEPTKIEPNPADTAIVTVKVAEFTEYVPKRTGSILFTSSMKDDEGKILSTETPFTITQSGLVIPTIAEVIAAGPAASAKTQGVIVAKYQRGALISDGTAYMLVYKNAVMEEVVGDKIEVNGPTGLYGGMLQFTKDAVITKISSDNAVIHPEPTVLDGAGMDAQLAKASVEYIEYVGTLAVSGTYYNVTIEGASTAIGSLQYIDPAAFPKAVDGAKIKVRGYFIGVSSGKYVNTMTVAVVDPEEEIEGPSLPTIAQVIAAGAQDEATTQGVVVATYTRGALINDGTASILLYNNAPLDVAVGDEVKVAGTTTMYAGMLQFAKDGLVVTKLSSGNAVNHPAPTVLDAAGMDAQLAKTAVEYIEYVGTLSVSGNYYNVNIDGATTAIGSLQYIDAAAHPAAVHGAKIKVRGYFIGVSSSKYVNTMTVSVEAAE